MTAAIPTQSRRRAPLQESSAARWKADTPVWIAVIARTISIGGASRLTWPLHWIWHFRTCWELTRRRRASSCELREGKGATEASYGTTRLREHRGVLGAGHCAAGFRAWRSYN